MPRLCSCRLELKQLETKSIAYRRHCGGTHRLLLGFAIRAEGRRRGRPIEWARSQDGVTVMIMITRCNVGWMHVKFSAALLCARPPGLCQETPQHGLAPL